MNLNRGIKPPVVVYSVPFTNVATTPAAINAGASGVQQIVFVAETADCWVVFGPNAAMAVADSGDFPLYVGQPFMMEVGNPQRFLSVVRQGSTNGVLKFYIVGECS